MVDATRGLDWLHELLRRLGIFERLIPRPRAWQTGCLSSGTFAPPSDIPVSNPPPVGWTWIPGLWEEFGGSGTPPNGGPVSVNHPSAKHVDRLHPAAANDPNGGTSSAPWATIQFALANLQPGGTVYVHRPNDPNPAKDGMYEEHLLIDGRQGSPALPFWVIAEGDVRVSDLNSTDPGLRVQNSSYWAIQNFKFDGGGKSARLNQTTGQIDRVTGVEIRQSSTAVVIHDCHVYGWTQAGISLVGSQSCIIYRCRVMDNERGEEDCHGMQVLWDCQDILVYGNTTRGNSGDGIQLQQGHENSLLPGQQPQKPPGTAPRNVTVHSNHFTGDRENGVDLKNCLRVSIQRNDFDGYTNEPAIVVHCSADEIVIERNVIHNSCGGVTVGAWNGRVGQLSFRFNKVLRLTAGLRTSGTAVRVSHTRRAEIYHNTMWQLDMNKGSGVRLADISIADTPPDRKPEDAGVDTAAVFNNIVVEAARGVDYVLPAAGQAIGVLSLLSDYNVLFACKQAIVAAFNPQMHPWIHAGVQYDCETRTTDPGLASPSTGDLAPTTSEAIDRAASLAYPPSWHQVCGGGPDIGAIEVCRP